MLNHLLSTRYSSAAPPLVILSDSFLQPGLSLFQQLVSSSPASTSTVVLCAEQPPSRVVPCFGDPNQVQVIDCTVDRDFLQPPIPASSTSGAVSPVEVDLSEPQSQQCLEQAVVDAIKQARARGGPVQIAIDSINSFAEELGTQGVWRLLKKGLRALEGLPLGTRIVLVHHDHSPSLPPSMSVDSASSPALLSSLLSPLLSPSTIHLALHPTSHFHTLSTRFSLTLPSRMSPTEVPDLRTTEFLSRLRERGVGDPFRRPERSDEQDERIPLDSLSVPSANGPGSDGSGNNEGKAVLGWNCRGVTVGKVSRISATSSGSAGLSGAGLTGGDKKVVTWGFEGLRRKNGGKSEIEAVELGMVLEPRRFGNSLVDNASANSVTSSAITNSTRPNASAPADASTSLPFSLSLTPSQLAARSQVANPYEGSNKPIFGEAGYTGRMDEQLGTAKGLRVEYTADRGDDLDEEEPDEDLEI